LIDSKEEMFGWLVKEGRLLDSGAAVLPTFYARLARDDSAELIASFAAGVAVSQLGSWWWHVPRLIASLVSYVLCFYFVALCCVLVLLIVR
jgi:hypothetical protein